MATFLGLLDPGDESFEMFVTVYQSEQCGISEELNLYQHCSENIKTCKEMEVKTSFNVLYLKHFVSG
jgi:hypothetical protein